MNWCSKQQEVDVMTIASRSNQEQLQSKARICRTQHQVEASLVLRQAMEQRTAEQHPEEQKQRKSRDRADQF